MKQVLKKNIIALLQIFVSMLLIIFCQPALSDIQKRSITLEWEEVPETVGYEVEVTRILRDGTRKSPNVFKSSKPMWVAKIFPGKYEMRLRSRDSRGVKGEWSEPSIFWVRLPAAEASIPTPDTKIITKEELEYEVEFKWKAVQGSGGYRLEVFEGENGSDVESTEQPLQSLDVTETFAKVKLPVAAHYRYRVVTLMPEDKEPGELNKTKIKFTLIGKKLEAPSIDKPQTKFVTDLKWAKPNHAQTYSYAITRQNPKGNWEVLERKANVTESSIKLNPTYPGGPMKLAVKAMADLREPSDVAQVDFNVYEGSRTPAAIEEAKLREAIEKESNSYFIASYLVTMLDYKGRNPETNPNQVSYSVLGGTGRVGYGYYKPKSSWGFVGIVDMAGVVVNDRNYTYASAETQIIWRTYLSGTTQFRGYGGLFAKQLPEVTGQEVANQVKNVTSAGPHVGFQIWHPFSYKFGMQLNGQVLSSLYAIETPNGQDIEPTISYQAGALGSYKIKDNITGFLGYAYRVDKVAYKAKVYQNDGAANFASEGDINEAEYTGHYLNLYLEWGF